MPKSKSKTNRDPVYNLQAQERRSERQVAMNTVPQVNDHSQQSVNSNASVSQPQVPEFDQAEIDVDIFEGPDHVHVINQQCNVPSTVHNTGASSSTQSPVGIDGFSQPSGNIRPTIQPPSYSQVCPPPGNNNVLQRQTVSDPTPVFSTRNRVVNDQMPSSSSATVLPMATEGPSRSEFLELKEQLAILTATLASMQPAPVGQVNVNANSNVTVPQVNQIPNVSLPLVNNVQNSGGHTDLIQSAVNNHIDNLLTPSSNTGEVGSYIEADRSVTLKVPDSIKQAIWANQYVDLTKLVDNKIDQSQRISYEFTGFAGQAPELTPKNNKVFWNLGQWCDAFMVYLTIYCKKYPSQLDALTSYMASVKRLASRGGDYKYYDQEFRYLRQTRNIPWDVNICEHLINPLLYIISGNIRWGFILCVELNISA